jgi:drug/metabolite transporter (DMT)-like permease
MAAVVPLDLSRAPHRIGTVAHSQRPIYALLLRLCSAFFISTLFMLVKRAGLSGIALPEIMFWRQAIPAMVIAGWLGARGELGRLRTARLGNHAGRAITGMIGMLCNFAASVLLPLPEGTVLGFTTPLFAVMIAAAVLRDPVGPWRWGAVLLGFLGVVVIAHPTGATIAPIGAAAALGAGLMVAIISFQIKDLARTDEPIRVVFYFALFGALLTAPLLPFVMHGHAVQQWGLLAAIGLSGLAGQLLLTASLRHGAVASVVIMDYSALIWAVFYGWLVWHDRPGPAIFLGAPLIIVAGSIIAWRETVLARRISPVAALEGD